MRNFKKYIKLLLAAGLLCAGMLWNITALAADAVPPTDATTNPEVFPLPELPPPLPVLSFDYRMLKYLDMPVNAGEKWQKSLAENRISSMATVGMPDDGGPLAFYYHHTAMRKQEGNHSLSFTAGSMGYTDPGPLGADLSVVGGSMAVTYRYHGVFGGVLRPVLRVRAGAHPMWRSNTIRGSMIPITGPGSC